MKIDILTLFPEFFQSFFNWSIIGRAVDKGIVKLNSIDIRDFSKDKHKNVDDYPYGGGAGMVMKPEPIYEAIQNVKTESSRVIYLSPKGTPYSQDIANRLSKEKHLIFLCGHYEGIDNRIVQNYVDEEISIGDYVLTGGEIPALVLADSIIRLIPGVLGSQDSHSDESHYNGLLEYPQYTRPRIFNGHSVPDILLSGNHKKIDEWRLYKSLELTYMKRPDLIKNKKLTDEEKNILDKIYKELNKTDGKS